MVHRLNLEQQVMLVEKSSPAAKNRFIKYNGTLNKMPTSLQEALFPPKNHVFRGVLARGSIEPFIPKTTKHDESIHDFVARRFGVHVADNLISALVHGIYAGDSRVLSVKSCFPFLWEAEQKYGSVVAGLLVGALSKPVPETYSPAVSPQAIEFIQKVKKSSIYAFKDGLQTLTDAIAQDLQQNHPNVSLLLNTPVTQIEMASHNTLKVSTATNQTFETSRVISCLPSLRLAPLLPKSSSLPPLLSHNPAVTVAVVNLAYNDPNILPVSGFGYLTPRTQGGNTIGVIFDSEAIPGQGDSPGTTRITCMMGGHRFKELFPTPDSFSEEKCLQLAVESVQQDLGITRAPDSFTVSLHKECITQYRVGHSERMKKMHAGLRDEFEGRLAVCGMSYLGVGVNDCVLSAREVVERVVGSGEGGQGVVTGLERV
ncbi:oxygen-dependent protoporphyrinogen oxidase [Podochytrium sp. JEL0797]|nr:oxygen-dependent protoporphyrinogen oxidase [Podochytrium sp. JEL0797]